MLILVLLLLFVLIYVFVLVLVFIGEYIGVFPNNVLVLNDDEYDDKLDV